ncbi:MAG TPA: copper chaperone PCu(A)C [Stellaceae bacterium]|jgi:hypothetical protein|nr:copper chaperone PCu(A)C [Stellaceae bacterium]
MSRILAAFAAALLFAGNAASAQTAAQPTAQTGDVSVTNAWARATPGQAEIGAAYLTLTSPTADHLTAISTPVARKAELHTMTMDGNVMKMRSLSSLDLPAGQPVSLKPGGAHIMLMGLKAPLRAGESFPLTLQFDKAGTKEVNVAVTKPGAMGPDKSGSMPMPAGH